MAVETFTDAVVVDGSQDITQLRVQAHSTQNQPLQTWENNAGNPLARLNSDGRLELGDVTIASTPNAFLEADQGFTSASPIKQGVQSRGVVSGAMSDPLAWSVHELEFKDAGGVSTTQKALRGKIIHANTGSSTGADLRAGDFEVENQSGSSGQKVGQATGVHGRVTNGPGSSTAYLHQAAAVRGEIVNNSGDTIDEASAFEVVIPTNNGTITDFYGLRIPDLGAGVGTNRYAIKTGLGVVQLGDSLGIGTAPTSRLHVAQEGATLNPLLENAVSATEGNTLSFRRARGTLASKTLVNNGDYAGHLSFEAWDGSAYRPAAFIEAIVDGTPGTNDMPGRLVFWTTPDGSVTPVESLRISQNGEVKARDYVVNKAAGNARALYYRSGDTNRWVLYANAGAESGANAGSDFAIGAYADNGTWLDNYISITRSTGDVQVTNTLSKGGGSFLIDHPLDPTNRNLIHSFVEGPRADLIYRGKVQLVNGAAQVSIDAVSNMTEGTFEVLTRHAEAEVFVQNKSGWANVRGEVVGGVLHIECQDPTSRDTVAWLVVAERADPFIQASHLTDMEGRFIVEADKPVPSADDLKALDPRYDATVETVQVEVVTSLNGKRGYPIHPAVYGMALPTREVRPIDE